MKVQLYYIITPLYFDLDSLKFKKSNINKKAPQILNELNIKNSYKEYPVGHGVHPNNFYDFKEWILARL